MEVFGIKNRLSVKYSMISREAPDHHLASQVGSLTVISKADYNPLLVPKKTIHFVNIITRRNSSKHLENSLTKFLLRITIHVADTRAGKIQAKPWRYKNE